MKVKHMAAVLAAFALFLYSCDDGSFYNPETDPSWGNFWAIDARYNTPYRVDAEMLASEEGLCEIWVDKKSGVSKATADAMLAAYVEDIYPKMTTAFGMDSITVGDFTGDDTMAAADFLGDGNGMLTILLLDIRDGYRSGGDSYVAGYFWNGNFLDSDDQPFSNERDMIYVDTYPAEPGLPDSNATVAHEMQHLMNYVTSQAVRKDGEAEARVMEVWIDEGLAVAAERIYSGEHPEIRWQWFSADPLTTISQGNNFYVWGNHEDKPSAILDDYATVYMFFQWLRVQFSAGNNDIYKSIIMSEDFDFKAVTAATGRATDYPNNEDGWATLLKDWLTANYVKDPIGLYGYRNDPDDSALNDSWTDEVLPSGVSLNVEARTMPKSAQDDVAKKGWHPLDPGEAVYSLIDTDNTAGDLPVSSPVKYATMKRGDASATFAEGSTLLSFNVNTDNGSDNILPPPDVDPSDAVITGHADNADWNWRTAASGFRSVTGRGLFSAPAAVSVWDMLRRTNNRGGGSGNASPGAVK